MKRLDLHFHGFSMRARRSAVVVCAAALAILLVSDQSSEELLGRLQHLSLTARLSLADRRREASATDFDRGYFATLEWARQVLPKGTLGVAVVPERPIAGRRVYLAIYNFVPTPAVVWPAAVPPGWLVLMQGSRRLPGWRVVSESSLGALLAPPS